MSEAHATWRQDASAPLSALVAALTLSLLPCACLASDAAKGQVATRQFSTPPESKLMRIRLTVNGKVLHAILEDNAATRDFRALLPITLTLKDYAATEKIADLPSRLNTADAPAGIDPDVGDITYYAPWGNLAIFYRDFGYAAGLVRLGRIVSGVDALRGGGSLPIRIEVETP